MKNVRITDSNYPLKWFWPESNFHYNDGRDGISTHQFQDCLLNRLFRCRLKKTSKLRVTGLCAGNSPSPVNSPHKGPVTWKMFPPDDVIISGVSVLFFLTNASLRNIWPSKRPPHCTGAQLNGKHCIRNYFHAMNHIWYMFYLLYCGHYEMSICYSSVRFVAAHWYSTVTHPPCVYVGRVGCNDFVSNTYIVICYSRTRNRRNIPRI